MEFKPTMVTRDKSGHYIKIRRSIYQEDKTIIDIYALNMRATTCTKQILTDLKRETAQNNSIIIL